jgi:hypothetical protein
VCVFVILTFTVFCLCTYLYCFVVILLFYIFFIFCSFLLLVVLCIFFVLCIFIFVCTSVGLLPPGESPIAVSYNNICIYRLITLQSRKYAFFPKSSILASHEFFRFL